MTQTQKPTFSPLPVTTTNAGKTRRCGTEIEFSGLTEIQAADVLHRTFGGDAPDVDGTVVMVRNTELGDLKVELDTQFAKGKSNPVKDVVLDVARLVVPVEIITEPLEIDKMDALHRLITAIEAAGGKGTTDGALLGFGIHFNPEITGFDDPFTCQTILAYALVEPCLRDREPVDPMRKALPFIKPWPTEFVDALCNAEDLHIEQIARFYSEHTDGRNYALDLLPMLRAYDENLFQTLFPDENTSGRPAFHFRLPDCRLGEDGWTISQEWMRWVTVEEVATRTDVLESMRQMYVQKHEDRVSVAEVALAETGWEEQV